jgi:predicted lactoylglutathione lyase
MKPHINVITVAVQDLEKSLSFYRDGMGLPTKGIVGTEFKGSDTAAAGAVVFFELNDGLMFALYPRTELGKDAYIPTQNPSSTEFSLGYTVNSKQEVDDLLRRAQVAGGTITHPAENRPWGIYSGYFKDLDGHLWEIVWNPGSENVSQ